MLIDRIGNLGFISCGLGIVSFVVIYSAVSPWWRSVTGRLVWIVAASAALIMLLASYYLAFGPLPFWGYIRAFAYHLFSLAIWAAVVALVRVQILRRRATSNDDQNVVGS